MLLVYGPRSTTYDFGPVTAGWQEVFVKFPKDAAQTNKAVYTIRSGSDVIAEVPIEQPSRFEFAVNAKTARSIGTVLPQSLVLRADVVVR